MLLQQAIELATTVGLLEDFNIAASDESDTELESLSLLRESVLFIQQNMANGIYVFFSVFTFIDRMNRSLEVVKAMDGF